MAEWTELCRPVVSSDMQDSNPWFASCDWVRCECLWEALIAPVPADELAPCFRQALSLDRLSQDTQWFVTALMRTCRHHTDLLSQPCGVCDKYKASRTCPGLVINTTAAPDAEIAAPTPAPVDNTSESIEDTSSNSSNDTRLLSVKDDSLAPRSAGAAELSSSSWTGVGLAVPAILGAATLLWAFGRFGSRGKKSSPRPGAEGVRRKK